MIAVDSNILVYAHREEMAEHSAARNALRGLSEGTAAWAIPWPCVHEFLSVTTDPGIFRSPSVPEFALRAVDDLAGAGNLVFLSETLDHGELLRDLILRSGVRGPLIHDARIAAICLGHGISELWTRDTDFNRFPGLRTRNPLV